MKYKTSLMLSFVFLIIAIAIPMIYSGILLSFALIVFMPGIILLFVLSVIFAVITLVKKRTMIAFFVVLVSGLVAMCSSCYLYFRVYIPFVVFGRKFGVWRYVSPWVVYGVRRSI